MKQIKLSQGKYTLVDDADFNYLNQWKWYYHNSYAKRHTKRDKNGKQKDIMMHRLIMNPPKGMETDHIDGNGLNNQKNNLRICTYSQNAMNRIHFRKDGVSKYKGVAWYKNFKRWTAHLKINGKEIYLGIFIKEKDAALAYNQGAQKYFGEFAKLNKI